MALRLVALLAVALALGQGRCAATAPDADMRFSTDSALSPSAPAGPDTSATTAVPLHPPLPAFDVQPWEASPVGGGLPPEPLVYFSNSQKFPPAIASGLHSPLATAHYYPRAQSPWFPYQPPNTLPRALPGPYNALPLHTLDTLGYGAAVPQSFFPASYYPQGFGQPYSGYFPGQAPPPGADPSGVQGTQSPPAPSKGPDVLLELERAAHPSMAFSAYRANRNAHAKWLRGRSD